MSFLCVAAAALFFFALGMRALIAPNKLLSDFGIVVTENRSRNEIRAVYGGFPLAAAGLLGFSLIQTPYSEGIMLAVAVSSLGMAVGRIISAAIDRCLDRFPAIYVGVEVVIAFLITTGLLDR